MKLLIALLLFLFSTNTAFAQESIQPSQSSIIPTTAPAVITSLDLREYVNTQSDRMVDRIDKMLMWVLGLGTLIIAVVALIGGYIVWNNAQFRKQALDDLDEIRSSKNQVNKIMTEAKVLSAQLINNVTEISANLKKSTEETKSISDVKKSVLLAAQEIDSVNKNYLKNSLIIGTASPSDYKPYDLSKININSLEPDDGSGIYIPGAWEKIVEDFSGNRKDKLK